MCEAHEHCGYLDWQIFAGLLAIISERKRAEAFKAVMATVLCPSLCGLACAHMRQAGFSSGPARASMETTRRRHGNIYMLRESTDEAVMRPHEACTSPVARRRSRKLPPCTKRCSRGLRALSFVLVFASVRWQRIFRGVTRESHMIPDQGSPSSVQQVHVKGKFNYNLVV